MSIINNSHCMNYLIIVGFGEIFDSSIVRGVMVIRANSLCRAKSGVRISLIQFLCSMLKADIIPVVPKRGSVSASGDLMPTSYIGAAMVGRVDSKVLHHGKVKLGPQVISLLLILLYCIVLYCIVLYCIVLYVFSFALAKA